MICRALVRAIPLSAAFVLGACIDRLIGVDPSTTPAAVYDQIWHDLDRNYSFFDYKHIDWNAAYARHRVAASSATSLDELAPVIGDLFAELNDVHVDLTIPGGKMYRSVDTRAIHTYFTPIAVLANYAPSTRITASRNVRYGKIGSDVGYIWIGSFGGASGWGGAEIDEALASFGNVLGVIVDVRNNGGGSTNNSTPAAGRFVDARQVFAYVRYRNGPAHSDFTDFREETVSPAGRRAPGTVVLLTNRLCASATESFVLAMRTNRANITVGDTTIGALGNPLVRELPQGWEYRFPQWIEVDASKRPIENIGIAPDIYVQHTAADSIAGRDPQMERAIALIKS